VKKKKREQAAKSKGMEEGRRWASLIKTTVSGAGKNRTLARGGQRDAENELKLGWGAPDSDIVWKGICKPK